LTIEFVTRRNHCILFTVAPLFSETLQRKADPDSDLDLDLDLIPRSNRVTFNVFTTDQFFVTEDADADADENPPETVVADNIVAPPVSSYKATSMVVAATINGIRIENLTQPVEALFLPKKV
jgi:hypothetical protein